MLGQKLDVAIIGAGPYGLSIAAHLPGRNVRLFGKPMQTWLQQMPRGMQLKSDAFASSLYDPAANWTLEAYFRERGLAYADTGAPVPLETFSSYGLWFSSKLAIATDDRSITAVEQTNQGFVLRAEDGEEFEAQKVVVAAGITHFARTPDRFSGLPASLFSHSSAHHEPASFNGKDVTVLGAGASALDLAMLLSEAGATTRVIARSRDIVFGGGDKASRPFAASLRRPRSALGSGWSLLAYAEAPNLFRHLPGQMRRWVVRRALPPAAPWYVRERLMARNVPLLACHSIEDTAISGRRLVLRLADAEGIQTEFETDHLIAATGYRADVRRLPFLTAPLVGAVATVEASPRLNGRFESTVPGLHFVGLAAANTFGPVQRFAYGAKFAARQLAGLAR